MTWLEDETFQSFFLFQLDGDWSPLYDTIEIESREACVLIKWPNLLVEQILLLTERFRGYVHVFSVCPR